MLTIIEQVSTGWERRADVKHFSFVIFVFKVLNLGTEIMPKRSNVGAIISQYSTNCILG